MIKETKGISLDTRKQRSNRAQSPENGTTTSDISQRPWAHYYNSNKFNSYYLCDSDKLQFAYKFSKDIQMNQTLFQLLCDWSNVYVSVMSR